MALGQSISADAAMHHHLRYNHFPPIIDGEEFARLAIAAVEEGEPDRIVKAGTREGRAEDVVESWHLDFFLSDEDEEWSA
jgi:hypothetical protein